MAQENNLLMNLLRIIGKEALRQASDCNYVGNQDYHIESVKRLPNEDGGFCFEVTTWSEESDDPRKVRKASAVELMGLIADALSYSALSEETHAEIKRHAPY